MITQYKDHPLSELLPLMEDSDLEELATDIRQNTQRAPITLYENKILDGRNRYRACKIANVEPKVRHFTSGDAVAFIVSANVFRRHLNTSQRAMVAAKLANLSNGQKPSLANLPTSAVTQNEAAKELKVSPRTVRAAQEVIRTAPKKEVQAIESGKKTIHAVTAETKGKQATAPKPEAHLDKTGYAIPETVWENWQRADEFNEHLRGLSRLKKIVSDGLDQGDVIFRELNNGAVSMIKNIYGELKCVVPYAVCSTCQGRTPSKCVLCKGRGFLSEFAWNQFVPQKIKDIRKKMNEKK